MYFSLFHRIPLTARPTYHYDLRAGLLLGAYMGLVSIASYVARRTLHATDWQLALIASGTMGGYLFSVLWARFERGKKKMPFVFWPGVIGRSFYLFLAFSSDSLSFSIILTLAPFIFSIMVPAYSGIMRANYPASHRATIMGFVRARMWLVAMIAALAAGKLLDYDHFAYRYLFPIGAGLGILGSISFKRIRVRQERHLEEEKPVRLRAVFAILLRDLRFTQFTGSFFIAGFASIMLMPLVNIVLSDDMNASYTEATLVLAVIPMGARILSTPVMGMILDRYNPVTVRAWVLVGFTAAQSLFFAGIVTGSMPVLYLSSALSGFAMGGANLLWMLGVMYFAKKEDVPLYMGLHTTLTGLRGLAAPWAGNYLSGVLGGARYVWPISAAMVFLASLLMFRMAFSEKARTFAEAEKEVESR